MTRDLFHAVAPFLARPGERFHVRCMRCEFEQPLARTCRACSHEHADANLTTLLSPENGARWRPTDDGDDTLSLPPAYLDLSLRQVLVFAQPEPTPIGEGVDLEKLHAAVRSLAEHIADEDARQDAEQREWLAAQVEKWTTELPRG